MQTLFSSAQVYELDELSDVVRKQLESLPRMISTVGSPDNMFRFEFRTRSIDLLAWLHNNQQLPQVYVSSNDIDRPTAERPTCAAGLGIADEIRDGQDLAAVLQEVKLRLSKGHSSMRYYGGFAFTPSSIDDKWARFGSHLFILPQFELYPVTVNQAEHCVLAINIKLADLNEHYVQRLLVDFSRIRFDGSTHYRHVPQIDRRMDIPDQSRWRDMVATVLNGDVQKVVLARETRFEFDMQVRPNALIKFLQHLTPRCHHFCFQLDEHTGFLGASPEILLRQRGRHYFSHSIAGTAKPGEGEKLLKSEKLLREHRYVHDFLDDVYQRICHNESKEYDPHLLKLSEADHLCAYFEGESDQEVGDVLAELHPTPAVGGVPRIPSLEMIKMLEPFARGWYASPVGWVSQEACDFFVGIRSGLIHQGNLYVYAGAGIVEGSDPQEEWDEIEQKIGRFMKVFGE